MIRLLLAFVLLALPLVLRAQTPEPLQRWTYTYDLDPSGIDEGQARAVATDAAGNVYIGGVLDNALTVNKDAFLLKLNPSGELLWDVTHSTDELDSIEEIAVNAAGHVYTVMIEGDYAMRFARYTTDGVLVWERRYQSIGLGVDVPRLALVGNDGFYVALTDNGGGEASDDIYVFRYGPDGTLRWQYTYTGTLTGTGPQFHNSIVVTADGGLVVAGKDRGDIASQNGGDGLVFRLTPTGALAWDYTSDGADIRSSDSFSGVGLDAAGNIYASGTFENTDGGGQDFRTVKLTADGQEVWSRDWDNPDLPGDGYDGARALVVAADGTVYVTGDAFYGFTTRYQDVALLKYSTDGVLEWWDTLDAPGYTRDSGVEVLLDDQDRPIVVGSVKQQQDDGWTHLVAKYTTGGDLIWADINDAATENFAGLYPARAPSGALYLAWTGPYPGEQLLHPAVRRYDDRLAPTVATAPVGGDIVIGAEGGSFQFTVTLTNPDAQARRYDVWTAAEGPLARAPVQGPRGVTIPAGGTITRTLRQPVPAATPPGLYTYTVHVGDFGAGESFERAAFPFEKQGSATDGIKLTADDADVDDAFGSAVAVDGDVAIVGAPGVDANGFNAVGAAYVYRRSGTTWLEEARLSIPGAQGLHEFGFSVAIQGDVAVIGAPDNTTDRHGKAYVYRHAGGTWMLEDTLEDDVDQYWADFGWSVAVEGDRIAVGAPGIGDDDGQNLDTGAAYVFQNNGGDWVQEARLDGTPAPSDRRFGEAVAMSGDAVLVGAPEDASCGAGYVFRRAGGAWAQETRLAPSDCGYAGIEIGMLFGSTLALDSDVALFGAPRHNNEILTNANRGAAYVFRHAGGTWTEEARLFASDAEHFDQFGSAVALDGTTALVGAQYADEVETNDGAAYVVRYDGGTWAEQDKLTASDAPGVDDRLGAAVALDGPWAFLGTPENDEVAFDAGATYVYDVTVAMRTVAETPPAAAASVLAQRFALSAVVPNPARGAARLMLELAEAQPVRAEVYDALGRRVAVLHDGPMEAGAHVLVFEGSRLPAGVYVVRVTGEGFAEVRRVTRIR